ncbi:hypothetical protein TPHA_0C04610 [Tetrapisispora phaffii CBS 4417]|uniref:Non-structural maintenance of chromosomes element 4 n=1 Tax=Tetrapisispora phaffii (strain ATCC 24235 / CBS 4417 / NBRC 1672 / NRRL Y-8282 / UCD 70-5) TaxID=1071381 RepID=G8BQU9_TETPH|nr:hypothetical protein TPHA_0C04610 [Tetrapisispora phaffii CBS 4417]CCE62611.1 hypothetical protein TPHA_0C04610 [Tetrapisispora phaffii CBS 4417]
MSKRSQDEPLTGSQNKRTKTNIEKENNATTEDDYTVLQGYKQLEEEMTNGLVRVARTGAINIAFENLEAADILFSKVKGTRNNGLLAHDAKAMVNISKLAELSVRNLKFDDTRSLVNLDDILKSSKKYMLKDYFKENDIKAPVFVTNTMIDLENENEDEDDSDNTQDIGPNQIHSLGNDRTDQFRQQAIRQKYLKQFANYNDFMQFNWYKLGALYDSISKKPTTTGHFVGPFSVIPKVRAVPERNINDSLLNGRVVATTVDKITSSSLSETQDTTTPEQVIKCFKKLKKKLQSKSNNNENENPEGCDKDGEVNRINLFKFVINPNSFSATIENLFYTSFLIKEGKLIMEEDKNDGLPYLLIKEHNPKGKKDSKIQEIEEGNKREHQQHHIIYQLDMPTWRKLIDTFEITESFL